jgi:hypothetical protein
MLTLFAIMLLSYILSNHSEALDLIEFQGIEHTY